MTPPRVYLSLVHFSKGNFPLSSILNDSKGQTNGAALLFVTLNFRESEGRSSAPSLKEKEKEREGEGSRKEGFVKGKGTRRGGRGNERRRRKTVPARITATTKMAFMMPVMKNEWDIYKTNRSRRSSECSNPRACRSRKVSLLSSKRTIVIQNYRPSNTH